MVTNIYLIRHAESIGNINGKFCGWTDLPLTEKGKEQAKLLGGFINNENIDAVYSSTLKRAMETAEISLPHLKEKITYYDELKEINGGLWEMTDWEVLPVKWPEEHDEWENNPCLMKMPEGESVRELYERSCKIIDRIIEANPGRNIAVYTHGTVIKAIIAYLSYRDICMINNIVWHENASVTLFRKENESIRMIYEGECSYICDEMSTIRQTQWYKKMMADYEDNEEKMNKK